MSGWMDSFNQAVGLTDDPADAANAAISAQTKASDSAMQLQRDQFNYQKSLQDPFFQGSLPAYYSLVGAITGQPQSYVDPNYTQLSKAQVAEDILGKITSGTVKPTSDVWIDPGENRQDALNRIMNDPAFKSQFETPQYMGPNGQITGQAPMIQAKAFNPTETDAYKWQQSQMEKNTGRTLRSLGRANSSYGMNVMADQNRNLAASEYDKQLGRLADLTNIARGGASSLAQASTGYTNAAGQNMINQGNNLANSSLAGGMLKQNSLYNNQSNLAGLANLGLKGYDYGKAQGWWGGGNDYGATWNDSGGDINKVDFGDDWGNWSDGSQA